jgi:hypothetical protein
MNFIAIIVTYSNILAVMKLGVSGSRVANRLDGTGLFSKPSMMQSCFSVRGAVELKDE